ncbi:MAG TPA: hypothetical protein VKW78_20785 [Terriglobales bacterium]|nr:hypothetical protein [Terriglobales bacterium]
MDLFEADGVAGEDSAEVHLLAAEADASAVGNGDDLIVEGIVEVGQAAIGARRGGEG